MSWQKFDDSARESKKIRRTKLEVIGFWWAAGNYCAAQLNDGFIPRDELEDVFRPLGHRVNHWHLARACVSAGLFVEHKDHFEVKDFLEFNTSREEAEAKRETDSRRQKTRRARDRAAASRGISTDVTTDAQRDTARDSTASHTVTPERSGTESVPPGPARPGPAFKRESARVREAEPKSDLEALTDSLTVVIARAYEVRAGTVWSGNAMRHHVRAIAAWLTEAERVKGSPRERILESVMEAFFADPRARKAGYPLGWLAREPSQYDRGGIAAAETAETIRAQNEAIRRSMG